MDSNRPRSSTDTALASTAHELQRVAGDLQKHASGTDPVPALGTTLAHVEEALDRLSVAALQMANGVTRSFGDDGLPVDEDALPPEARALCFHLRSVASALRPPQEACTSSRIWTRRLTKGRLGAEPTARSASDTDEHWTDMNLEREAAPSSARPSLLQS